MMSWMSMNFQDAMSPMMFNMLFFHEFIMMIIILILTLIMYFFFTLFLNSFYSNKIINHQQIELIWTIFPLLILFILAIPSIKILYMTEEMKMSKLTVKSIGYQWYWSYEYPQFKNLSFESFMMKNMIKLNQFRLLDTDNSLFLPFNVKIRILTTSNDVIHSFTIPSMGFKMDSIPGRLNQSFFFSNFPGTFFGQCSEICGTNHSFMPIKMNFISPKNFYLKMMKFN